MFLDYTATRQRLLREHPFVGASQGFGEQGNMSSYFRPGTIYFRYKFDGTRDISAIQGEL